MTSNYKIVFAIFAVLTSAPMSAQAAQDDTFDRCFERSAKFADCMHAVEREFGGNDPRLVEPLLQAAERSSMRRQYDQADAALERARDITRSNEGLFTRSQSPILLRQTENHIDAGDWAAARKLQDHLIWLFGNRFSGEDKAMIGELQALSRSHMRGVAFDGAAHRVWHFVHALYCNRFAIAVADRIWPENEPRKAELLHEQLEILYLRASHAMDKGALSFVLPDAERFSGSRIVNLSEKLTLGDIRKSGNHYLERLRRLFGGDSVRDIEGRGMVALYAANWSSLFGREAEAADFHSESSRLLRTAGIPQESIGELMGHPLFRNGLEFQTTANGVLQARSSQARETALAAAAPGSPRRVSFSSP